MPDTLRTFVAIPIVSSPSLRMFIREAGEIDGPIRWMPPQGLHLTLKFLGDTPWTQTAAIGQVISEVATIQPAFDAVLKGIGAFPNLQRPRVIWAGMEPLAPLALLSDLLNDLIGDLGFPREEREFAPHVTLARVRGRPPLELIARLDQSQALEFGGLLVDRLVYYQSELRPQGPVYTVLSEHPLA